MSERRRENRMDVTSGVYRWLAFGGFRVGLDHKIDDDDNHDNVVISTFLTSPSGNK